MKSKIVEIDGKLYMTVGGVVLYEIDRKMKDEELFKAWKSEQYKDQSTEEKLEFVEHLHTFPKYFEKTFLAGLKAGRPQWHKVADGDLPKDKEYVLVYTDLNNYYVAEKVDNHFMSKGWGFIPMSAVIAWCEIPTFDKE